MLIPIVSTSMLQLQGGTGTTKIFSDGARTQFLLGRREFFFTVFKVLFHEALQAPLNLMPH